MAKINIKIKNIDLLEFELTETGKIGDYFSLNDILNEESKALTGSTKIWESKLIKKHKSEIINQFKNEDEFINLNDTINKQKIEIEKIKGENKVILSKIDNTKNEAISNFKDGDKYQNLLKNQNESEKEIIKLKNDVNNSINNFKNSNEYINLTKSNIELNEKYNSAIPVFKASMEWIDLNDKLHKLETQLENANRQHNDFGTKKIGEDFEKYIWKQLAISFENNDLIEFYKENEIIDNQKADYRIDIFDENKNKITKILIEAKTEYSDSVNKKTNDSHIKKFKKSIKDTNSNYGLLVSELEKDDIFFIKKITSERDENFTLYLIRPEALITIVSIIYMFCQKYCKIIEKDLEFLDKQEIFNEFEEMKNNILENSLKNLENNIKNIKKSSDDIKKCCEKIDETINKIINTHMVTIQNKIENFSIKKIVKEIEKITCEK